MPDPSYAPAVGTRGQVFNPALGATLTSKYDRQVPASDLAHDKRMRDDCIALQQIDQLRIPMAKVVDPDGRIYTIDARPSVPVRDPALLLWP